ncbi:hypothetical protein F4781DRAFT_390880 [Annulohypoxylon bovei var. microspora]|nr:hypothetical protein F4781DRAFT_390880 [Annulohypoxylon bovei var. microspora]
MFRLLQATCASSRACLLPHDVIYGILGLWNRVRVGDLPQCLQPNYDQSFDRICHQYAPYFVANTGDLRYLVSRRRGFLQTDLPSWVPDFRYLAGSESSFILDNELVSISDEHSELRVSGWELGVCVQVLQRENSPSNCDAVYLLTWAAKRIELIERQIIEPAALVQEKLPEEVRYEWLGSHFTAVDDDEDMMALRSLYGRVHYLAGLNEHTTTGAVDYFMIRESVRSAFKELLVSSQVVVTAGDIAIPFRIDNEVASGDKVCWLIGAQEACVLRPRGDEFELITFCILDVKTRERAAWQYVLGSNNQYEERHTRQFIII